MGGTAWRQHEEEGGRGDCKSNRRTDSETWLRRRVRQDKVCLLRGRGKADLPVRSSPFFSEKEGKQERQGCPTGRRSMAGRGRFGAVIFILCLSIARYKTARLPPAASFGPGGPNGCTLTPFFSGAASLFLFETFLLFSAVLLLSFFETFLLSTGASSLFLFETFSRPSLPWPICLLPVRRAFPPSPAGGGAQVGGGRGGENGRKERGKRERQKRDECVGVHTCIQASTTGVPGARHPPSKPVLLRPSPCPLLLGSLPPPPRTYCDAL